MIEFKPYASGSGGNLYTAGDGQTKLLLECGIPFRAIQQALNFQLSSFAGCLITHCHQDHCKAVREVMKAGIDCYMTAGTAEALGVKGHRLIVIKAQQPFTIGSWTVLPFETEHDAAEPVGYLLASPAGEKLLYATDTYYLRYTFNQLNIIVVECNHSYEILDRNLAAGALPVEMKNRLIRSHFSLENVKDFFRANDLSRVREIWLIHLSNGNSDEALFKREIQALTGKPVYVA